MDRNTCLWGSYAVLAQKSKFFFTGDTAYCSVFKRIGAKYGPFDLAAIPIGAYAPRWFMKDVHNNPEEAIQIHKDLCTRQSVAIHWGTFPLADEDPIEPALELARVRDVLGMAQKEFSVVAHGETFQVGVAPLHDLATTRTDLYELYLDSLRAKLSSTS
jgi:N-acyl-phosphatidylethanolamine-hydrolysing phospholipase D